MTENSIHPIMPLSLSPGDVIQIVAPGSPFNEIKFSEGISVLEKMGFQTVFSREFYQVNGYLAGPDTHRAEILNAAFSDDRIKGIWCARGGYGALRILKYIDFEIVRSNPKIFIGCSDASVLLNTFFDRCGLITFHGPMIESLSTADEKTREGLNVLFSTQALTVATEKRIVIYSGIANGIVSGGNLTTICHMVGTPFQPNFSGHILLLEDTGEAPYRIDRMLTQMKMACCFDGISGMILGSFEKCGEIDHIHTIFHEIFSDMDIPILAGLNVGHGYPNLTIPFGIKAYLDTDIGTLTYQHRHLNQPTSST
jgi:muramoyltetrapeptide carboxypeptidase